MKTLDYPDTNYLLDVPIDALHADSIKWLKEIDFWKQEMSFFYKLLHTKHLLPGFPSEQLASIDQEIIRINTDQLDKYRKDIHEHEQSLAGLVMSPTLQQKEALVLAHQRLLLEMFSLSTAITDLKKTVFTFFEKYQ